MYMTNRPMQIQMGKIWAISGRRLRIRRHKSQRKPLHCGSFSRGRIRHRSPDNSIRNASKSLPSNICWENRRAKEDSESDVLRHERVNEKQPNGHPTMEEKWLYASQMVWFIQENNQ